MRRLFARAKEERCKKGKGEKKRGLAAGRQARTRREDWIGRDMQAFLLAERARASKVRLRAAKGDNNNDNNGQYSRR
jgi:hypothetical protein